MNASFADLVDDIRQRSLEEKDELFHLLRRDLVEARREEFARDAAEARREHIEGKLQFSTTVAELKRSVGVA